MVQNDVTETLYKVESNYYCHNDNSTTRKDLSHEVVGGKVVTIYYTDQESVYEIVID